MANEESGKIGFKRQAKEIREFVKEGIRHERLNKEMSDFALFFGCNFRRQSDAVRPTVAE